MIDLMTRSWLKGRRGALERLASLEPAPPASGRCCSPPCPTSKLGDNGVFSCYITLPSNQTDQLPPCCSPPLIRNLLHGLGLVHVRVGTCTPHCGGGAGTPRRGNTLPLISRMRAGARHCTGNTNTIQRGRKRRQNPPGPDILCPACSIVPCRETCVPGADKQAVRTQDATNTPRLPCSGQMLRLR